MTDSEREYGRWVHEVIASHPDREKWLVPSWTEPEAFRKLLRALYLASFGSEEAMDLADGLHPWPVPTTRVKLVVYIMRPILLPFYEEELGVEECKRIMAAAELR